MPHLIIENNILRKAEFVIDITDFDENDVIELNDSEIYLDEVTVTESDDYIRVEDFDGREFLFYECDDIEITISDGVVMIDANAFSSCQTLEKINIPESVKVIGENAFSCCWNLKSVTIPSGVQEIQQKAFYTCANLEELTLSNGVTSIGKVAFECCSNLTNIVIPESVQEIGYGAFNRCKSLRSVNITKSTADFSQKIFDKCDSLDEILADDDNTRYCSIDGLLFNKDKTELILYPMAKKDDFCVPNGLVRINNFHDDANLVFTNGDVSICVSGQGFMKAQKDVLAFYNESTEENFKKLKKPMYKIPFALLMILSNPNEETVFKEYTKNNIKDTVKYLIDNGDTENLEKLLSYGFVTKNIISDLISYADEKNQIEMRDTLNTYDASIN